MSPNIICIRKYNEKKLDEEKGREEKNDESWKKHTKLWRSTSTLHVCGREKGVSKVNLVLPAPDWHPSHLIFVDTWGQFQLNPLPTVGSKWSIPVSRWILDQCSRPTRTPACPHIEKGIGCFAGVTEVVHNNLISINCYISFHIVAQGFQHDSLSFVIGRCQHQQRESRENVKAWRHGWGSVWIEPKAATLHLDCFQCVSRLMHSHWPPPPTKTDGTGILL